MLGMKETIAFAKNNNHHYKFRLILNKKDWFQLAGFALLTGLLINSHSFFGR